MLSVILSVVIFSSILHGGNAVDKCPVPPEMNLLYFDMAQISSMMLHNDFTGVFREPKKCQFGNDKACDNQICCGKEVGCCYTDRTCGCKAEGSATCSFPSPMAVMGKIECNAEEEKWFLTCFRESRIEDNFPLGKNSTKQIEGITSFKRTREDGHLLISLANDTGNSLKDAANSLGIGPDSKRSNKPSNLTAEKLEQILTKSLIDSLIHLVAEKKNKGEPYGQPE